MNPKIRYYKNGNKYFEEYFNDLGLLHNENAPAYSRYYQNRNKECESYYINGKFHNIKGPAIIYYNENNEVVFKQYWVNGEQINVNSDEEFQKHIKLLNIK